MIEIRQQSYEIVQNFEKEVIAGFAKASGHPFGFDEFAFEALHGAVSRRERELQARNPSCAGDTD